MEVERYFRFSELFRAWKGIFITKMILDKDSYLSSHIDDESNYYICYGPRLKFSDKIPKN